MSVSFNTDVDDTGFNVSQLTRSPYATQLRAQTDLDELLRDVTEKCPQIDNAVRRCLSI